MNKHQEALPIANEVCNKYGFPTPIRDILLTQIQHNMDEFFIYNPTPFNPAPDPAPTRVIDPTLDSYDASLALRLHPITDYDESPVPKPKQRTMETPILDSINNSHPNIEIFDSAYKQCQTEQFGAFQSKPKFCRSVQQKRREQENVFDRLHQS